MSTLKTNKIENVAGTAGYDIGTSLSFRNKFINGDMSIWQRGITFNVTTSGEYTADRWLVRGSSIVGGTVNVSQSNVNGVDNHMKIDHVGGTSNGYVAQKIEGKGLLGKTVTYSCEVFIDSVADFALRRIIRENGVNTSDLITTKTKVSTTGAWVKLTFTVDLPDSTTGTVANDDNMGIYLQYYGNGVDAVGTNSIRLRKVQIEEGSIATPFEQRGISLEELMCKRYYESLGHLKHSLPGNNTVTTVQFSMMPRVTKRTTGTLTIDSITLLNATNLISLGGGPNVYTVEWTLDATTNQCYALFSAYVNAEL
jgi:hypothetical protein